MTLAAVRAEIVTKLKTVDPLSGRSYGAAQESLQVPAAFVGTLTFDPRATFEAADLTVQVWVATAAAASFQRGAEALDAYMPDADHDVTAALQAAGTAWDSLVVTGIETPITITVGAGEYVAARFDCEVYL